SRSRLMIVLAVGVLAVTGARASAAAVQCAPPQPSGAQTAADRLQSLIDYVPCPDTGRVSFNTRDDAGDSMSVLDTVPSPSGGYLGVYHTEFRPRSRRWFADFRVSLARSSDLIHWTRVAVLDPSGASMPTLRAISGSPGYLLAYEKRIRGAGNVIRIRYYPSLFWLLSGAFADQRDLPLTFSPYNNGTPTILWVHWNGGPG